ncbi:MAG: ABC transporter ATP-binding protein [Bacteroidota bacterium]
MRTYYRIIEFGRAWWGWGAWAILAMLVYTLFSAVSLVAVIPFLEILFGQTAPAPTEALIWYQASSLKAHAYYQLSQWMLQYPPSQILLGFCALLLVAILIKNIARYMGSYCMAPLENGIVQALRNQLFAHLTKLDLSFYTRNKKGDIISRMVSDVNTVTEAIISTLQNLFREPLTVLVFLAALLFISWQMTLFILIILPLTALAINGIARPLKRDTRRGQAVLGELTASLDEFLSGMRIVKAFQREAYEREKYEEQNTRYTALQVSISRRLNLASPVTEIVSLGIICVVIFYGGTLILSEEPSLKASEFIGFLAVFTQFLAPIKLISTAVSKIQKGNAAYGRIEQLLDEKALIKDQEGAKDFGKFKESIAFEAVDFAYTDDLVLSDINFRLKKGEMLALVGPSGAGKSTLADLLPRFYDPSKGKILLDGLDIKEIKLVDLRAQFGIVTQEGILFHDSVFQNIAYGLPNADPAAVKQAAQIANADEFIAALPDGYQTIIGERGTRLSGGQRQRIAIARAILRNPPILILDEATSNLDTQSEKAVQEALDRLMRDRTSIVIAHRLSTIQQADQILVIDNGKIIEAGKHAELLQNAGLYRKLHDIQFA